MAESFFVQHARAHAAVEAARQERNDKEREFRDANRRYLDETNGETAQQLEDAGQKLEAAEYLVAFESRKLKELKKNGPSDRSQRQQQSASRPSMVYTPQPQAPTVPPPYYGQQLSTVVPKVQPADQKSSQTDGTWKRKTLVGLMAIFAGFGLVVFLLLLPSFFNAAQERLETISLPCVFLAPGDTCGDEGASPSPEAEATKEPKGSPPKVPNVAVATHPPPAQAPSSRASPDEKSTPQPMVINIKVENPSEVVLPELTPKPTMALDVQVKESQATPEPSPEAKPERTKSPDIDIKVTVTPVDKATAPKAEDRIREETEVAVTIQDTTSTEESFATEVKSSEPVDFSTGSISITSSQATPPPRVDPEDYGLPSIAERKAALKALEKVRDDDVLDPTDEEFVPAVCLEAKRRKDVPVGYWKRVPYQGKYRIMEGWSNAPGQDQKLRKLFLKPHQAPNTLLGGGIYTMPKSCALEQALAVYKKTPLPSWGGKGHNNDLDYLRRIGIMR